MCEPSILRLCCIVQYVSWCPYFMHCELNHVGPITSDATTCFSVKCGCARLQHHAPPFPLLPSSLWGVGSGGGGGVGLSSASQVAAYHARDTTATPAEGCVRCCTSPCASLCVLLCRVPRLSSLQHCSIPKDRPPQSYKEHMQLLPAINRSEALDSTFAARSGR